MARFFALFLLALAAVSSGAAAQDLASEADEARRVIQRLRAVMMEHLQRMMAEVGAAGATKVCRQLAPEIAAQITQENRLGDPPPGPARP